MAISNGTVMWVPMCHAAAQGRVLRSKHVIALECTVGILPLVRKSNPFCAWNIYYGIEPGNHLLAGRETCGNLIHTGQGAQHLRLSRLHITIEPCWNSVLCSSASYQRAAASFVMGGTAERLFDRTADVLSNGKPLKPCRRRMAFNIEFSASLPV